MKADGGSVSRSVLETLSDPTQSDKPLGRGLNLRLIGSELIDTASPFFAALYETSSVQGKSCQVRLETPQGWNLAQTPTFRIHVQALRVEAQLESGEAEHYLFGLDECFDSSVSVHVQIGGE